MASRSRDPQRGKRPQSQTGLAQRSPFRARRAGGAELAVWTAAVLVGMTAAAASALLAKLHGRSRWFSRPTRARRRPSLAKLGNAIVGNSKSAVASVFGPPRTAMFRGGSPVSGQPTFWHASTWYYSVNQHEPLAMAIEFDGGFARGVEFIRWWIRARCRIHSRAGMKCGDNPGKHP
jgi:hypothetical protein